MNRRFVSVFEGANGQPAGGSERQTPPRSKLGGDGALLSRRSTTPCAAAPDVHLQDYVGREVGVTGSRSGYMIDQHANHLIARHITPLDDTMLR